MSRETVREHAPDGPLCGWCRTPGRVLAGVARAELTGRELPGSRAGGKGSTEVVIDLDATLLTAHSDKEDARGNFKGGFGHHPLRAWLDNTNEALAMMLRPGNAGRTPPLTTW